MNTSRSLRRTRGQPIYHKRLTQGLRMRFRTKIINASLMNSKSNHIESGNASSGVDDDEQIYRNRPFTGKHRQKLCHQAGAGSCAFHSLGQ